MAKRTTITVETDSLFVLRGQRSLRAWCPQCSVESEMIPLNELSAILNLPESEARAWLESEDLHHAAAADGSSMICVVSMLKRVRRTTTVLSA